MFTWMTRGRSRLRAREGAGPAPESPDLLETVGPGSYLDVPTCNNVRELGGYQTPEGMTKPHRFIRSGDTCFLDQRDIDRLRGYGLSYDLDLRGREEAQQAPDLLAPVRGVRYKRVQLHVRNIRDGADPLPDNDETYMANIYLRILRNTEGVRQAFEFMAKPRRDDCLLFHCAAGMDRTGIVSMLTLGLCGVSRDDIIRDYLYSFVHADQVEDLIAGEKAGRHSDADGIGSVTLTHTMGLVYQWVCDRHGSARGFLLSCGVAERSLDRVKDHLLA